VLGGARLAAVLDAVHDTFGLSLGAEITIEANPEPTSPELFDGPLVAGYTRVPLGMQIAPRVLAVLDRVL
jgi:coproporphyrinogen III oxidase-like Fe-S oxidoreductase